MSDNRKCVPVATGRLPRYAYAIYTYVERVSDGQVLSLCGRNARRLYPISVMGTTLSELGSCVVCELTGEDFLTLASSWLALAPSPASYLLAMVESNESPEAF